MSKNELIEILVNDYGEDKDEMKKMSKKELEELIEEFADHSDLFPNDDEYDGSHEYD